MTVCTDWHVPSSLERHTPCTPQQPLLSYARFPPCILLIHNPSYIPAATCRSKRCSSWATGEVTQQMRAVNEERGEVTEHRCVSL
jgi:hypothetical protein